MNLDKACELLSNRHTTCVGWREDGCSIEIKHPEGCVSFILWLDWEDGSYETYNCSDLEYVVKTIERRREEHEFEI